MSVAGWYGLETFKLRSQQTNKVRSTHASCKIPEFVSINKLDCVARAGGMQTAEATALTCVFEAFAF